MMYKARFKQFQLIMILSTIQYQDTENYTQYLDLKDRLLNPELNCK